MFDLIHCTFGGQSCPNFGFMTVVFVVIIRKKMVFNFLTWLTRGSWAAKRHWKSNNKKKIYINTNGSWQAQICSLTINSNLKSQRRATYFLQSKEYFDPKGKSSLARTKFFEKLLMVIIRNQHISFLLKHISFFHMWKDRMIIIDILFLEILQRNQQSILLAFHLMKNKDLSWSRKALP